jgi:hypothetical protein
MQETAIGDHVQPNRNAADLSKSASGGTSMPTLTVRGQHNRALSLNHVGVLCKRIPKLQLIFMPDTVSNQS